jgi:hypothetical protein
VGGVRLFLGQSNGLAVAEPALVVEVGEAVKLGDGRLPATLLARLAARFQRRNGITARGRIRCHGQLGSAVRQSTSPACSTAAAIGAGRVPGVPGGNHLL